MSILQFSPVKVGQAGVRPATYKMVSNDDLTTITAAGYIKQGTGGQFLQKNDLVEVISSFGTTSQENDNLYVTIDSNGVITLNADLPEGLGQAALKNVSDNTKPLVASVDGATVVGHVAVFADITGTVEDGGALGQAAVKSVSDNALSSVASVNGATVIDNLASFNDITGTVEDSGIAKASVQLSANIKAATTADIGGGGAGPISVVVDGLTAASVVVGTIESSSNSVQVQTMTATATGFDVTFSGDPGASCFLNYVAFVVAQ